MKCFDNKYNTINKTEIHCHLGGSIRTATIIDIAREHNLDLPSRNESELNKYVKVYRQMKDLESVLRAFGISQKSFASPKTVERIAYELFEDAAAQNIRIFEMRFSPDWAFSAHNLHWNDVLDSISAAKERAENEFDMMIGLITISSRGMGTESCRKTIDWTIKNKDIIQGIDLADGEDQYPIKLFKEYVLKAKEAGLMVTVHSGENTPAAAVRDTIMEVSPDRIGHGIHIVDDEEVVDLVVEKGITLEISPWSNYLTNSVGEIEEHPLKRLFDMGVKTTINSDDPELLDTNLNNEYRIAHEILGMSLEEIATCNRHAVKASFIPEHRLKDIAERYFR